MFAATQTATAAIATALPMRAPWLGTIEIGATRQVAAMPSTISGSTTHAVNALARVTRQATRTTTSVQTPIREGISTTIRTQSGAAASEPAADGARVSAMPRLSSPPCGATAETTGTPPRLARPSGVSCSGGCGRLWARGTVGGRGSCREMATLTLPQPTRGPTRLGGAARWWRPPACGAPAGRSFSCA